MSEQYKINKKISSGTFGTVYDGINLKSGEKVAIKQLFCNKKVLREVYLHEKLNHCNIVRLYQYQVLDQMCSIYMEYCDYDLQQFIQSANYPLDADLVRTLAHQILLALEHIHSHRIVHRDLKPSNIMISKGLVKVGDFGSAEHLSKLDNQGQYSAEGFSKWYMAPEQLFGSKTYTSEVDIWAFGCIYAEILVGLPLFCGKGEIDQIIQIGNLIGSPTEENWPKVKELPDYGKINFKQVKGKNFRELFDLADDDQIEFLQDTLKYQDRPTATQLLHHPYFQKVHLIKMHRSMQISNYEQIVVHKKNNIIHILNISEIMHSEPHFSDGNILEHKIKALEINSTQFYSQMKPLFTENTQLKQHLISMNYFQEERKIQLCKLINDTGPNGEDRVLTKAVADLKQVCDLIEEEFSRLSQVIILHKNTEEHLSQNVQSLQSKIQSETDHHFKEKQALIDQNRRQSEYYRKLQKEMAMSLNQQVMKNEDLSSQIMELKYRENLKSIKFQKELEEQTQFLRIQIIELTELKNQMQESFEAERRAYLKQLEMMNIKLRQIKEETVDEYEYKLASQRMKLENQITTIKQETTSLRTQLQNSNDKQRTQQAQIDRLNHYIQQLEKEIQEYKYRIFQLEEQLKQKDLNLKSQQSLIDTQKQQLERLRQDFNKKLIEANSYNNGLKRNSTKQIPEKGKLWKQASTLIKREPFSKSIQQNQTKKNADFNEHNSLFNSEEKTTQLKNQIIESNQEQLFNENENENEEQSSNNLQQQQFNDQEQFLSQQSQQSQFSQYENLINSPSQHNSVSPLKSPIKQDQNIITLTDTKTFYVHQVTQTENQNFSEQLEIHSLKPHQDVECQCETDDSTYNEMINQLKRQLNQQIEQHQQRLGEKEIQIKELEIELVEKEKSFNQQMKIQQQESELIFQEEIDKKDILVSRLQKQIEDLLDRNKGLEENVKQYEELQEEIHQIYEIKLENKDKEINGILEQLNEEKLKGEREQQRLLKLGQEEKMEYQQQLENLMNQHQLDQEQIELEKQRFSKEKSDNKQFKQEAQELFQQVKSKEELLDNYRRELMKSTEIVKYLQLELENYKKINNIFKPKNNDFQVNLVYNGLGFLPIEVQDRIKQKVNKTRHKEMQMKQSQIDGKAYALNFSQQRQIKMKPARLGQMLQNVSMDSKGSDQQLNIKQLIKTETDLPKISTKRLRLDMPFQEQIQNSYQKPDNRMVRSEKKQIKNKNQRSKTQCSDIEDQDLIQDINKREEILIKHSQQLLFSLNSTVQYKPPAVRKRNIK